MLKTLKKFKKLTLIMLLIIMVALFESFDKASRYDLVCRGNNPGGTPHIIKDNWTGKKYLLTEGNDGGFSVTEWTEMSDLQVEMWCLINSPTITDE